VSGTWWVNSGSAFTPDDAVPVRPGGYVKRTARTPHYDGLLVAAPVANIRLAPRPEGQEEADSSGVFVPANAPM
jgi:hypothetical protein